MSVPPNKPLSSAPSTDNAFVGDSEMGKLVRSKDWSSTPLGPIASWPASLRTAVSLVLNSNFPISLAWGPQHTQIYNDGYWPICGNKHPTAMGQDFTECWASAFPVIGAAFRSALAGTAVFLEDQRLFVDRLSYLEETFFTFSFSPIHDEHGAVAGLFHPVTETTSKMLGQRRTRTLRDLTATGLDAHTVDEALRRCAQTLTEATLDIPFALFYRIDADRRAARLVAQAGLPVGANASPVSVDLTREQAAWPLARVAATGAAGAVNDLQARFPGLNCGPYPEPLGAAYVLPITPPGHEQALGLMVVGVSTRLPLNEAYTSFHELLGATVSNVVASAQAAEAERKRVEALAEIDRAKTLFFSNISHEFRTPLTLMLGPLEDELAERAAPLPAARRERLIVVQRSSQRLLKLVNTLLDFSRIEAGRAKGQYQATDLATQTAELASLFRAAIEKAGLSLIVDCPPLPEPVYVDRDMWEKVVLNLLSNSFKHTFEGAIRVTLRWCDDHIELEVADSGTGIPAEELPRLFERFHRVKAARSRTHEGSGIGLALVQELVQMHGGTIRVSSEEGKGSAFTVTIKSGRGHLRDEDIDASSAPPPSATRAAAYVDEALHWLPQAPVAPTPTALTTGAERERIIWADDNADIRDYVSRLLSEYYDVTAVANGAEAVAAALAAPPDLVLTDIMMPGLDGYGVLRELRANERTRYIPVILLSARAGEESVIDGLDVGADDYLVKPFAARELLARVRKHLSLAKLRRDSAAEQARTMVLERDAIVSREALATAEESRRALLGILEDQQRAEAARKASEQTLRLTLDAARIGHWELDLVTHTASRSLWHDQIFGYPEMQPDWTYEKFLTHVHPEDRDRVDRLFQAGVTAQTEWNFECRIIRPDGALRWIWGHGNVFTNAAGAAVRMLGMVSDITERKQAEAALQEANQRAAYILDTMSDAFVTWDQNWIYSYVNTAAERTLGRRREELLGQNILDLFHPDPADPQRLQYQRAMSERVMVSFEMLYPVLQIWVEVRAYPSADGGLSVFFRDITERILQVNALRESESRYRLLVQNSPYCVHEIDRNGRLISMNPVGLEMMCVTDESAIRGMSYLEAVADVDKERIRRLLDLALQGQSSEFEFVAANNLQFQSSFVPIRNEEEEVLRLMGLTQDITERKQAEQALRDSEERLRLALDAAHMGTFDWDIPNNHIVWSRWHEALWGFEPGEFDGTYEAISQRVHHDDLPGINMEIARCIAERVPFAYEFRVVWPDGGVHWIAGRGEFSFGLDGLPLRLRGAALDITERRQAVDALRQLTLDLEQRVAERTAMLQATQVELRAKNEELQNQYQHVQVANRMKSEFLANMSHELRTPLNAIIGFSELIHDGKVGAVSDKHKEYLGDVLTSARHLLQLINDVLDIAKVESGKLQFYPEPVDLGSAFTEVRDVVRALILRKHMRVTVAIDPHLTDVVTDLAKLKQILYNYLSNAIKFSPEGSEIVMRARAEKTEYFRVEVEDHGIGIAPADISRLFSEFQQLNAGTAKQHAGTGLGLALTKRIAEAQGGHVSVESRVGQGSVFVAVLPRTLSAELIDAASALAAKSEADNKSVVQFTGGNRG